MKALIQRVSEASIKVSGRTLSAIDQGLVVLLGVEKEDSSLDVDKLLHKVSHYRIFADDDGKMNLNVQQINGSLLIVSQFTLAADTKKGLRPGFSSAAEPILAEALYDEFITKAKNQQISVGTGQFGADMQVALINDGPVTFWLSS
ncbi:MAG: D-tyrosyl-tRNA(Tyr) deacylase [Oleispira antarctica]|uniref:D-aminoacyl-tRNA deacylase n=1 Tax=Oleispira antarctica RB-8 TaxID=698738 RepID=R4YJN6_OLEAN|nr:D-tyrosyl-tRNA(Tyr) deacylase [Oleispira antarctica]MBQ0794148.1 D-tyrosyl-tRNA(Tyr) deacylase [Oleispira antarctica]CCK74551.1 D-tyrosyl-tRNA(Tyr) deacylase [Oleispira antarctica RB-8]|tara:strand:+ start:8281 stop:8718 length:438 start_codon:yes stop_codon:yes gene_type:complete